MLFLFLCDNAHQKGNIKKLFAPRRVKTLLTMLLTMPVYISTYMLFSIICTVYSTDIGSMKCRNEWIDGSDIKIICIINDTSLDACPGNVSGFADFTFTRNGSTIERIQCTVQQINVNCSNVFNSGGCGCQDHSGGNYVLNYNTKANKTIHSGGSWGCKADCLKIPTQECSNIIFALIVGEQCDGTNALKCKTGLTCEADKCMIDAGGSCAGTNATMCKSGLICEADKCIAKDQPCPTWCIIVIVVVIILGIIIIIIIIVGTYYLKYRLRWRCICICCPAPTPDDMHRGQNCLCVCLIPNTRPTQENDKSLDLRHWSAETRVEIHHAKVDVSEVREIKGRLKFETDTGERLKNSDAAIFTPAQMYIDSVARSKDKPTGENDVATNAHNGRAFLTFGASGIKDSDDIILCQSDPDVAQNKLERLESVYYSKREEINDGSIPLTLEWQSERATVKLKLKHSSGASS